MIIDGARLEAEYLQDQTGLHPHGDYVIKRTEPYSMFEITRPDGEVVSKTLRGLWTSVEDAKRAIDTLATETNQ